MRGVAFALQPLDRPGHAAARVVDGRLDDLLIDPPPDDPTPQPGAIYRALAARPMKGMGGMIVDLGDGQNGFLREVSGLAPGRPVLVQVAAWAEPGKAPPVSRRLRLKGRYALLTPGAPGRNLARTTPAEERLRLAALVEDAMAGAAENLGLILRTAAIDATEATVTAEIAALRREASRIAAATTGYVPECIHPALDAAAEAARDWPDAPTVLVPDPCAFAALGVWEAIDGLRRARVRLAGGGGDICVEATRALVAVDVNTGSDLSPAAALKANLAAMREIPRQLRLRGLGGQIVVDPAPLVKRDRPRLVEALGAALRHDPVDTTVAGWTPLGHLELLRKRARRPLDALLPP